MTTMEPKERSTRFAERQRHAELQVGGRFRRPARKNLRSCLMVPFAVALWSSGVAAEAGADQAAAREHFRRAEMAYKLGKYSVAIREYEAAYKAMAAPAFLFNIAQSYRQQYLIDREPKHLQKALALYRSYLRETRNPPNRQAVRKLIQELEAVVSQLQSSADGAKAEAPGKLVVESEEHMGAQVELDGKPIGQVPLSIDVPPGKHRVAVRQSGFRPWSGAVSVASGTVLRLPVRLVRLAARTPVVRSKPFYKRWWFWTAVGAVVVGGTGLGIYLGTRSDDPASPQIDLR